MFHISLILSDQGEEDEEEDQPLSLSWPESNASASCISSSCHNLTSVDHAAGRPEAREFLSDQLSDADVRTVRWFSCVFLQSSASFFPVTFLGAILLDRGILLPDGVVGSSGKTGHQTQLVHIRAVYIFIQNIWT